MAGKTKYDGGKTKLHGIIKPCHGNTTISPHTKRNCTLKTEVCILSLNYVGQSASDGVITNMCTSYLRGFHLSMKNAILGQSL